MKHVARTDRIGTIPNIICVLRILGSIVLVVLAANGRDQVFLWLFVGLAISDWVDGKLAILLNQRSVWGPHLDSWADAALYFALFIGSILLRGDILQSEWEWLLPALASYALSTLAGCWKYRRWPSYHTRAAKTSWFLILVGAGCLLGGWNLWPLRVALAAVTLTNLEALLITILSPNWQTDVESIFHVLRERTQHTAQKKHSYK
jgi:cardiolipin synthase